MSDKATTKVIDNTAENTTEKKNEQAQLLSQSEQLLTQAMSAFQLSPTQSVELSFPCMISASEQNKISDFAVDVHQTFAGQERLFQQLEETEKDLNQNKDKRKVDVTDEAENSGQIDAIRNMFDM